MKTRIYGVLILLVFFITDCQTKTKKINDIRFVTADLEKTYHLMENPENPDCRIQLSFTYPQEYGDREILGKIQTLFVSSYFGEAYETYSPQEAVARYTEDYINTYKEEMEKDFREEMEESGEIPSNPWFSRYEISSGEIVFNRDNLISYTVSIESYTGGAHGSHSVIHRVIDLKTGVFVTEEELFIEGYEKELTQLLVNGITAGKQLKDPKELEDIGFFSVDEIYPNGNFLIDETGITYSFNEYEIAAYVVGIVDVHIPYEKIKHLLRENYFFLFP
jgi:hypothetical protein